MSPSLALPSQSGTESAEKAKGSTRWKERNKTIQDKKLWGKEGMGNMTN